MHWDDGESLINAKTSQDWLDATYHLQFNFITNSPKTTLQVRMINKPKVTSFFLLRKTAIKFAIFTSIDSIIFAEN